MSFFKFKFNRVGKNKTSGLTMVETLVAISILTIAVIGPLGIIAQALHTSYYTRDQMTAYYLAQEAIEYVRNLRDKQGIGITGQYVENPEATLNPWWGTSKLFNDSLVDLPTSGDPTSYSLIRTNNAYNFVSYNSEYLKISNGIYGETSGTDATDSIFKREIYFKKTDSTSNQGFTMVVNVYWKTGSSNSEFTLEEYFTNSASKTGQ
jgi:hypothetical protein